jgi:hypothetical protein
VCEVDAGGCWQAIDCLQNHWTLVFATLLLLLLLLLL